MAMFKWSGMYINPMDVVAIYCNTDNTNPRPFYMVVSLRSGKEYRTNYQQERARDTDARRLAQAVDCYMVEPVTCAQVEDITKRAKDALRRDIKALREELTKGGAADE